MAQPGNFTPILLYASSTPTNVPLAANLTNSTTGSEIAINIADKNLFFKDSGGVVNTVPIRQSSTSSNGWLSNTDWNTFNGKAPATSGTSILYGNGTGGFSNVTIGSGISFAGGTLSATGTGGTVTSVAALTLGTTGTDLSSTVANGTTTPVITLNVPTASAANRGALSAADWSTFNGKQAALVSGTNIKTVGGVTLLGSGDVGTIGVGYGGTGLTSLTAGYIPFGNGTSAFGSSSNLFWDSANGYLGLGISAPASRLHVIGKTTFGVIGTSTQSALVFNPDTAGNAVLWQLNGNGYLAWGSGANPYSGSTEFMRLDGFGNLLIGTTEQTNSSALTVNGTGVTKNFSSSGNTTINTVAYNAGFGGGLCVIRGYDGSTGNAYVRLYVVNIQINGGAGGVNATLVSSSGTASATFTFAATGGFATITSASTNGGNWHASYFGL